MADVINLPTKEQFDEINKNLAAIAKIRVVDDLCNAPGNKYIIKGDKQAGFYGFVQPLEMGTITINSEEKEFNGSNLALACGLAQGGAFGDNVPLMKFSSKGKTLFVPLTGYRHSVSWDAIYNAGLAYGTNDEGFLPPAGRCGVQLSIDAADNSINSTKGDFLGDKTQATDYADTVATIGDKLTLKGWKTEGNNVEVTVVSITANKIVVSGATLATEAGNKLSRFYKSSAKVTQNKIVTIGGKQYRVRLLKGAGSNPVDTYTDSDRGSIGLDNEWNSLILPLHEHAKLNNWVYPQYAKNKDGGNIENWGATLSDEDLRTHYNFGVGSYTWCQENIDTTTYRRVNRGGYGASYSHCDLSWATWSAPCWRPGLESL